MRARSPIRLVIDGKPLVDSHFSGVGNYTLHLLRAVDELLVDGAEIEAHVAVPLGTASQLRSYGFRRLRPLRIPAPFTTFRRVLERDRLPPMDLILGRGVYFFPDFNRWPLARSKCITAVHDLCFERMPEMVHPANGAFLRAAVGHAVATSDLITVLTHGMKDEIIDFYGVDPERVQVVTCAADARRFYRRSDAEIARVKLRHAIFGDYLLAVGNIEPRKNQARLIQAFCEVPDEVVAGRTLVLAGAGAWNDAEVRSAAQTAIDQGRKVRILLDQVGPDDLPALYSGAIASAYVSVYEGFGMPPLESMSCGTPVLAGNRSVLPEVVGDAAHLVDPLRVDDIARGLTELLADKGLRSDLVDRGYANVLRYRWEDAATTLLHHVSDLGQHA